MFYDFARISCRHAVGRDVVRHHAAGANHSAVANRNTRAYSYVTAQPTVFADDDWKCRFVCFAALHIVDRVLWGVERAIRTY